MKKSHVMLATGLFLAGCGEEKGPEPTVEESRVALEHTIEVNGITVEPGSIVQIPNDPTGASFDKGSRWLQDFIAVPSSASAGGLFSSDREIVLRRFDGDAIEEGELIHAHTTSDAPCAEFIFDDAIVSAELIANTDGYAAQLAVDGLTLLLCDDRPTDNAAVAIRIARDN